MVEQKHETRAKKAKLAIGYITFGALMVVWSAVWLCYLTLRTDVSGAVYLAIGLALSGITVALIGMKVGDIGKEANVDEEHVDVVSAPPTAIPNSVSRDVEVEAQRTASW